MRLERAMNVCVKAANFRFIKTFEDFNFSFHPSINKEQTLNFQYLNFIENKNDNIVLPNNKLSLRQEKIIDLIKENKFITQEEIGMILGVSRYTIIRDIIFLESKNIVKREGSNKTGGVDNFIIRGASF